MTKEHWCSLTLRTEHNNAGDRYVVLRTTLCEVVRQPGGNQASVQGLKAALLSLTSPADGYVDANELVLGLRGLADQLEQQLAALQPAKH